MESPALATYGYGIDVADLFASPASLGYGDRAGLKGFISTDVAKSTMQGTSIDSAKDTMHGVSIDEAKQTNQGISQESIDINYEDG